MFTDVQLPVRQGWGGGGAGGAPTPLTLPYTLLYICTVHKLYSRTVGEYRLRRERKTKRGNPAQILIFYSRWVAAKIVQQLCWVFLLCDREGAIHVPVHVHADVDIDVHGYVNIHILCTCSCSCITCRYTWACICTYKCHVLCTCLCLYM